MAFAVFILYLVVAFVRPGEQIAALRGLDVMDVISTLAVATAGLEVLAGRGPTLRGSRIALVFALWAWLPVTVILSPVRPITFDGAIAFGKSSITAFLLTVFNVTSVRRVRVVAAFLTALSVAIVLQATFSEPPENDGMRGYAIRKDGGSLVERDSRPLDSAGDGPRFSSGVSANRSRIHSFGFLGDPNDLACTLVAIIPLTIALRRPRFLGYNVLLVWLPVCVSMYGIYRTQSRGGLLALACIMVVLLRRQLGAPLALAVGGIAGALLLMAGVLSGRPLEIDQSAQGRIEAWSAGLQMLKSSPLSGVGHGRFAYFADRVAHNSFVHAFAELGFVGYLLWLGVIAHTIDDLRRIGRERNADDAVIDLQRWSAAVNVSIGGFLVGAFFLSRPYDVALFILLGLGAAAAGIALRLGYLRQHRTLPWWFVVLFMLAGGSIVFFWVYMRVFR
jgi:hypothetical protein